MSISSAPWNTSQITSARTGRNRVLATLPLIAHPQPDSVIAYRAGVAITAACFLTDVSRVAAALPAGGHVLNVCADRYRFTVGFAACLLTNKVSLLPSTHTPEVIRQLLHFAPDVFCLTEDPRCQIALRQVLYPEGTVLCPDAAGSSEERSWDLPAIEPERLAAYVFTSGTSGTPVPFRKTWGRLVNCVRFEADRLSLQERPYAILGTVPPQHMFGFESTVLLAMQGGHAFGSGRPFYPADICSELEAMPQPRLLVSTPVHLRALVASGLALPPIELVLSATAPLSRNLADEVEKRFGARLLEIYGSTETGQIASRRTAQSSEWQLFCGVKLTTDNEHTWAQGGHVEQPTQMCDVLEMTSEDRFLLHGRLSDLVNIAGKRSSLAYLNHHLNAITGVHDGVFFVRDETDTPAGGVTRVGALVVAPGMTASALTRELRTRIDPVFLPRPLLFVEALPRNETGKLPQEALRSLIVTAMNRSSSL